MLGTDLRTEIGSIDKHYVESTRIATANPVAFTINCKYEIDSHYRSTSSILQFQ